MAISSAKPFNIIDEFARFKLKATFVLNPVSAMGLVDSYFVSRLPD